MTSRKHEGAEVETQARAEAERLVRRYSPEVLGALARILQEMAPPRLGRPAGSGEDDDALLDEMGKLLDSGQAKSLRDAAGQVAQASPGHSEQATRRRLRRKYAAKRDREAENDTEPKTWPDEIEQHFKNDVELWDL